MHRRWVAVFLLLGPGAGCATPTVEERRAEREQLKQEILAELASRGAVAVRPRRAATPPAGGVEGRILVGRRPLAGCRVRLVRMKGQSSLLGTAYRAGDYLETRTDRAGAYRFEKVPPGLYKLHWVVPGGDHWIRFLTEKPDLAVEVNRTTKFRDIQTGGRILGG